MPPRAVPAQPRPARTREAQARPERANVLWGRIVILGVLVALFFAGGRIAAPDTIPVERVAELRADIARAENQIEALRLAHQVREEAEAEQRALEAQALTVESRLTADTYVVQPGESMTAIAQAACGNESMAAYIATYNGIEDPSLISSAVELQIPPDCLP